jgi:hypothetical protein
MGADIRKELGSVLKDPENEKKMKKLFKRMYNPVDHFIFSCDVLN